MTVAEPTEELGREQEEIGGVGDFVEALRGSLRLRKYETELRHGVVQSLLRPGQAHDVRVECRDPASDLLGRVPVGIEGDEDRKHALPLLGLQLTQRPPDTRHGDGADVRAARIPEVEYRNLPGSLGAKLERRSVLVGQSDDGEVVRLEKGSGGELFGERGQPTSLFSGRAARAEERPDGQGEGRNESTGASGHSSD